MCDRAAAQRLADQLRQRHLVVQLRERSLDRGAGLARFVAGGCQRCTRVAEGGEVLDTVDVDRGCFSCMLGGDDGRTLFIVANRYTMAGASDGIVLTHRVTVPHAGRP